MGAFGNGNQHDIHDANAANQQRDGGNRGDQQRHGVRGFLQRVGELFVGLDKEIFFAVLADKMPFRPPRRVLRRQRFLKAQRERLQRFVPGNPLQ